MFLKRIKRMGWIVGVSVGVTLCSAGCRSGMSRANMFGFKSEPSAEMLAGDGPTMTYPAPPSQSSTSPSHCIGGSRHDRVERRADYGTGGDS